MTFEWIRVQKRKIVAAKKTKSKVKKGKEKVACNVDSDHENDDLGTEDVPHDECPPCRKPGDSHSALWGPFGDAPEVGFSIPASAGPRKRRPSDKVQGGKGGEGGEGSGDDDKRAGVTCPNKMK